MQILCTLSDEHLPGKKVKKEVLRQSKSRGDFGGEMVHDVLPMEVIDVKPFGVSFIIYWLSAPGIMRYTLYKIYVMLWSVPKRRSMMFYTLETFLWK